MTWIGSTSLAVLGDDRAGGIGEELEYCPWPRTRPHPTGLVADSSDVSLFWEFINNLHMVGWVWKQKSKQRWTFAAWNNSDTVHKGSSFFQFHQQPWTIRHKFVLYVWSMNLFTCEGRDSVNADYLPTGRWTRFSRNSSGWVNPMESMVRGSCLEVFNGLSVQTTSGDWQEEWLRNR